MPEVQDFAARRKWLDAFAALDDGELDEALWAMTAEVFMRAGSVGPAVAIIRRYTEAMVKLARQGAALDGVDPATAPRN